MPQPQNFLFCTQIYYQSLARKRDELEAGVNLVIRIKCISGLGNKITVFKSIKVDVEVFFDLTGK